MTAIQGTSALEVLEGLASLGIMLTGALEERQVLQDAATKEQVRAATSKPGWTCGLGETPSPLDVKHQPQGVAPYKESPGCVRGVAPVPRSLVKMIRKQSEVRHWVFHQRLPLRHDDGLGSDSSAGRDSLEEEEEEEEEEEGEEGEEGEDWEFSEGTREEFLRRFVTKRMDMDYMVEEVGGDEAMETSSDEVAGNLGEVEVIKAEDELVENFGSDKVEVMQVDDQVEKKVNDEVLDTDNDEEAKRKEESRNICYIRSALLKASYSRKLISS